ncbi:hypothetical protein BDB00DRAFT_527399 [Zychaea mexicana]|uniref:uncharacterized protein n=1 Tax=Zychaea mexicana TaxID=64656 RepID=UPI0022FE14B9|nr:uncharacterized protein BDB00DRAFT_527399 [Zychaea mexicana]KAI9490761.1 hypothetical protein BDB00DRAFT_527399 [Zychaea mexicana]
MTTKEKEVLPVRMCCCFFNFPQKQTDKGSAFLCLPLLRSLSLSLSFTFNCTGGFSSFSVGVCMTGRSWVTDSDPKSFFSSFCTYTRTIVLFDHNKKPHIRRWRRNIFDVSYVVQYQQDTNLANYTCTTLRPTTVIVFFLYTYSCVHACISGRRNNLKFDYDICCFIIT